jgi:hypothetical protein
MPKYVVFVERLVPQYRTVVVDAACVADIAEDKANQQKIFDAACNLTDWEYDDDGDVSSRPHAVNVVEATEDEADIRL